MLRNDLIIDIHLMVFVSKKNIANQREKKSSPIEEKHEKK
jgi:hypothetical protein